jgi:hypothetical protein
MKFLIKKIVFFFSLSFLFHTSDLYSQTQNGLDSLKTAKEQLDKEKKILLAETSSLKEKSSALTEKIRIANLEIEQLFTKKFGKEYGVRVFNKQIWKGMTDKMLLASWGTPDKIEKNTERWGTFSQWFYGKITFFFRDGKLTDWEELK